MAELARAEAVQAGEPHVRRCRDDNVGDHAPFQAAHAVGQHDLGHTFQRLKTARQHLQGRGCLLVSGKADEAPAAERHHGAEDMQAGLGPPVDNEHLTRCPPPLGDAPGGARNARTSWPGPPGA